MFASSHVEIADVLNRDDCAIVEVFDLLDEAVTLIRDGDWDNPMSNRLSEYAKVKEIVVDESVSTVYMVSDGAGIDADEYKTLNDDGVRFAKIANRSLFEKYKPLGWEAIPSAQ